MIRRPPRSTLSSSSAASDVYKRQTNNTPTISPPPSLGGSLAGVPCSQQFTVKKGDVNGQDRRRSSAISDIDASLLAVPATPLTQSFVGMESEEERIVRRVVQRVDERDREREEAAAPLSRTSSNNSTSSIDRFLYYEGVPKKQQVPKDKGGV
eukprot:TRINITY_DN2762_c0_g1_i2.p2 TRINITY_DN2762_c0_g1~~TRINITY_DN2762_c0_g1_i2.p2  ORF type:complete len:153 (+),score=22.82 TRINITY_DN2762_c0_g1_i2:150-608(+)